MPLDSNPFYRHAAIRQLLQRELHVLAPHLAGVFGTTGLFLRAYASAPIALKVPKIANWIELATDGTTRLRGGLTCTPSGLPLASESCKLIVVQHVFEHIDDADRCAGEIARVLAPDGMLAISGFNSTSLWRPWLSRKAGQAGLSLHFGSARRCAAHLNEQGIDTLQTCYAGTWTPWSSQAPSDPATHLLARLCGSWVLLARKRRSVLTPLRPRRGASERVPNAHLAPGVNRECA